MNPNLINISSSLYFLYTPSQSTVGFIPHQNRPERRCVYFYFVKLSPLGNRGGATILYCVDVDGGKTVGNLIANLNM